MSNAIGKLITRGYALRSSFARLMLAEAPPPHPLAKTLERDGVLVLPGALPPETVRRINEANSRWLDLDHPAELVFSPDGKKLLEAAGASREEVARFYFLHIKNYQRKFQVYREIIPLIDPILGAFYRSRYYVRDVYCYRTQPVPQAQGSYEWHRDNYPPGSLKVMTYLTDVPSSRQGPLSVAAGTRHGFFPELGKIGDRYAAETVADRRVVDCVGPAGTIIIFDNNSIHRATDPTQGQRDVINFTVFPSVLPPEPGEVKGLDLTEEATWLKRYTR